MCLHPNKLTTKMVLKRFEEKDVIFYKVALKKTSGTGTILVSAIKESLIKPGNYDSNRQTQAVGHDIKDVPSSLDSLIKVNRGIHVFLTRQDAVKYVQRLYELFPWNGDLVILEMTALVEDFVVAGEIYIFSELDPARYDSAVFMKVHLSQEEYDKARKGELICA